MRHPSRVCILPSQSYFSCLTVSFLKKIPSLLWMHSVPQMVGSDTQGFPCPWLLPSSPGRRQNVTWQKPHGCTSRERCGVTGRGLGSTWTFKIQVWTHEKTHRVLETLFENLSSSKKYLIQGLQWLRIHLPVQEARVWSLVWDDSQGNRACAPHLLNCRRWTPWSPHSATKEAPAERSPDAAAGESLHATEKTQLSQNKLFEKEITSPSLNTRNNLAWSEFHSKHKD